MIEYDIWDLLFHVTVMTSDPAGEAGARAWWQWPRLDGPQRVTECWCCHVSLWVSGLLSQASVNHIFVDLWFLVGSWRWHPPCVMLGTLCGTQRQWTSLTHPSSGRSGASVPLCAPHPVLSCFPSGNRKSLVCLFPSTLSHPIVWVGWNRSSP